jgi:hypothetical protein
MAGTFGGLRPPHAEQEGQQEDQSNDAARAQLDTADFDAAHL